MRKDEVMYGLVKKNDGTYALSEICHYGVGHLNGGHSGRYPWGSRFYSSSPTIARSMLKDRVKNVRFESKEEKKSYLPKVKDIRTAIINSFMSTKYAKLAKAHTIYDFDKGLLGAPVSGIDTDISNPIGYDNIVRDSRVFISGSEKISDERSPFYKKELPPSVKMMIDHCVINDAQIITGDNKGVDTLVQDYLNKNGYKNAVIYTPDKVPKYVANKKWKTVTDKEEDVVTARADTAIIVASPLKSDNNHTGGLFSSEYHQSDAVPTIVYSLSVKSDGEEPGKTEIGIYKNFSRHLAAEGILERGQKNIAKSTERTRHYSGI